MLEVDRTFLDFTIQVKPEEARQFAQLSEGSKIDQSLMTLFNFIDQKVPLSDRGKAHPASGRVHHAYRIGREVGKRAVSLELTKANFPKDHDFTNLLIAITRYAKSNKALVRTVDRDHDLSVMFLWIEGDL